MKPRAIPLEGWQVRALQEGRLKHLWFPILNWPPKIYLPRMVRSDIPPVVPHNYAPAKPGVFQPMSNMHGALAVLTGEGKDGWLGVKPDEWRWECPLGKPGRILWVQETWGQPRRFVVAYRSDRSAVAAGPNGPTSCGSTSWSFDRALWRPSTQMPRWASRYTMEIEEVEAKRIVIPNALSLDHEERAMAAGFDLVYGGGGPPGEQFTSWWNKKHGKKGVRFNYDLEGLPEWTVPSYAQRTLLPDGQLLQNRPWAWRLTVKQVKDAD